jgi:hypothetical protein
MRKAFLFTLLTLMVAIPSFATEDRHQSYLSYDDGGTVVRSSDDREIEAHRNLPIYPGDEVITARRGRAEVRLSDGNIIGIDRTTALRFRSILDSYEGDADETVVELQYGKVAVHRTDLGRDHVRLDTANASYVADYEAVYSVETDDRGSDRVTVFEGTIEIRTPSRSTRLGAGESVTLDDRGLYDIVGGQTHAADDFERWFLQRADRFAGFSSKYVDREMGYWADDLDDNGRWVFVNGIGWSWRPFVGVGWRPYHNGYWHHSRNGCLTWVSYDPWGWGPYHYGRWAHDPGFGWIWVPGTGYSPAWVYWMYGSGYVGWAPAGWWDCYRPYYNWAYYPYRDYGVGRHNFGFYGRVRVSDLDLRPWTFVDSGTLVSTRIDRAALTTDAVRNRLARNRDGFATMAGGATRFTNEEVRDPAESIRRRGLDGRMTGRETGAPPTDLTPFVRRDEGVSNTIRERLGRDRVAAPSPIAGGGSAGPTRTVGGGIPSRGGSVAPIGRGSVAPVTPGSLAPITGGDRRGGDTGTIGRAPAEGRAPGGIDRERGRDRDTGGGRDTVGRDRPDAVAPTPERSRGTSREIGRRGSEPQVPPPAVAPSEQPQRTPRESWRARPRTESSAPAPAPSGVRDSGRTRSDVPRRVIDRIGGARVVPRSESDSRERGSTTTRERSTAPSRERSVSRDRGNSSSGSSTRSSGGSSSGSSGSSASSGSRSSGSSSSSGGSRSGGGRIKRD